MDKRNKEIPADLAEVLERFRLWRSEHEPRTRIPGELWQLAIELARKYGNNLVYKTLLLDRKSLKKRLEPESV